MRIAIAVRGRSRVAKLRAFALLTQKWHAAEMLGFEDSAPAYVLFAGDIWSTTVNQLRVCRNWLIVSLLIFPAVLSASEPRGYRRNSIANSPNDREYGARLNDSGDIVFSVRFNKKLNQQEIVRYSRGEYVRLTENDVQDTFAHINNRGDIVWMRFDGPEGPYGPTSEIVQLVDGIETYLTRDQQGDWGPCISDDQAVVWSKNMYAGCEDANYVIELFDGDDTFDVTDGSYSDQFVSRNNRGQVVWGRYNFCQEGDWASEVFLHSYGVTEKISVDPNVFGPAINDRGVVAWSNDHALEIWDRGVITRLSDQGEGPRINSRGDVSFDRWNDQTEQWEAWLYLGGEFRLIAADSDRWNIVDDMNERDDIVVSRGLVQADFDVYLYHRLPDGDMNCDERVDFDDIDGFVAAITNRADYEQRYPECDWWLADMSGNRSVDFDDIDGFINCLVDGGCERK